jgi:hypothetical protein
MALLIASDTTFNIISIIVIINLWYLEKIYYFTLSLKFLYKINTYDDRLDRNM